MWQTDRRTDGHPCPIMTTKSAFGISQSSRKAAKTRLVFHRWPCSRDALAIPHRLRRQSTSRSRSQLPTRLAAIISCPTVFEYMTPPMSEHDESQLGVERFWFFWWVKARLAFCMLQCRCFCCIVHLCNAILGDYHLGPLAIPPELTSGVRYWAVNDVTNCMAKNRTFMSFVTATSVTIWIRVDICMTLLAYNFWPAIRC